MKLLNEKFLSFMKVLNKEVNDSYEEEKPKPNAKVIKNENTGVYGCVDLDDELREWETVIVNNTTHYVGYDIATKLNIKNGIYK